MVLDVPEYSPSSPTSTSDEEDELELELSRIGSHQKGLRTLHISHLLQMVLQDAQTRLFFKAQSVVQSEVKYYTPKPEDLAYPDKLVGACNSWSLFIHIPSLIPRLCGFFRCTKASNRI